MRFKYLFKLLSQTDKYFLIPIAIISISSLASASLLVFTYSSLPPQLPLFYSLPWGSSQLAPKTAVIILPALSTLVGLINLLLAQQLHPKQEVLKRTLTTSAAFISLLNAISFFKILMIFL